MIRNFRDHAANERTFLAWVRTSIAIMAFGFIVEKFDLFLQIAAHTVAENTLSLPGQRFANALGLVLIILGTAMIALSVFRFLITRNHIDSETGYPDRGSVLDIALAILLMLLGCSLFIYLSHAFAVRP